MKKAIIFLLSFYSCVGFAEPQQARSDYSIEESQAKVNKSFIPLRCTEMASAIMNALLRYPPVSSERLTRRIH